MSTQHTGGQKVSGSIETDQQFHLLSNERRRSVIQVVDEYGSIGLSELAERVASKEYNKPVDRLDSQERKRVYISLYQCHLPKMDDAGAIDYDCDRGFVKPRDIDDLVWYINNGPGESKPTWRTAWNILKN